MNGQIQLRNEDLPGAILPSQYNDAIRRRSATAEGEQGLLWAVLEDAIRTYVANRGCATAAQRRKFEEVRNWFEPVHPEDRGLFDFQNVCDLLGVEAGRLLNGIKALGARALSSKSYRVRPAAGARKLAA